MLSNARTSRRVTSLLFVAFVASAWISFAACGEPEPADPTPVTTWMITPADPGRGTPTPAATPEATSTEPSGAGGETVLEIAGVGSVFDLEELEAPAGDVRVMFDNQDAGVVHNIHFFAGEDADGESVGESELETGPIVQEVTMTLAAGSYFYQCDAHPTTMKGVLTVN